MRLIPRPIASSIASSIARPSLWLAAVAIIAFPLSGWCQQQTETQPATTTAQAAADAPAPSAAKQDSLAEAARKAREQKKESKPAKVFTNDNLPTSGGISTVGAAAEPSASSNTGDASTPDTRGTKSGSGDQKTWRDRFATLHHKLDQDTMDLDVMQRELGVLNVQYYNDPVKAMQQGLTRDDINKKTADIDAKKQAIEADQKAIDDAEEDLRKSGGDPGWSR